MRAFAAMISSFVLCACAGETTASGGARPFPSERGVIAYQMTGQLSGDETITWDSWGMRSVTVTNMSMRERQQRTRTIITPDATYSYSSETTGYVRINAGSRRMYGDAVPQMQDLGVMVEAGPDTVAGVECQSHVHRNPQAGMEICMAGHLPLRVVTPPYSRKTATSIRLNARVDPRIFEPDGEMMLEMAAPRLRD